MKRLEVWPHELYKTKSTFFHTLTQLDYDTDERSIDATSAHDILQIDCEKRPIALRIHSAILAYFLMRETRD